MIKTTSYILFWLCCAACQLCLTTRLTAADNWEVYATQGNDRYAEGDYRQAISQYQKAADLLKAENRYSADLQYNRANAHYKNGDLGEAILYWERALRLSPRHAGSRYNLRIARAEIQGEVIPIQPFFLAVWWKGARNLFHSGTWAIIGLLTLSMGVAGWLAWLFAARRKWRKYGFLLGIVFTVSSLLPFIWAYGSATLEADSGKAILMAEHATLRNAPDGTGDFTIYEGTELEILERLGDWAKVRLRNSDVGWVKEGEYSKV